MPGKTLDRPLIRFAVTPRFEVFHALRALGERATRTNSWRRETEKRLPKSFSSVVRAVAPRPIMWALLADSLREAKPDPAFSEILEAIHSLDDAAFQRAVLGGVFRDAASVDALIAGTQALGDAVRSDATTGSPALTLIGLHPFDHSSDVAGAFRRIISEPGAYREQLAEALETFWTSAFSNDWADLAPLMREAAATMQELLHRSSLSEFAREVKLPVVFDDRNRVVASLSGATVFPYKSVRTIHVIPSAFNDARIWGAYRDQSGMVRLYFPVFDPALLEPERVAVDPALGFRALGDTTRYAMAFFLAESPRTSVELAKAFGVSKATISHHVQLLRAAGLLVETVTDRGTQLALDRKAVERISGAAVEEFFERGRTPVIRRSRHETKKRAGSGGKISGESSPGTGE